MILYVASLKTWRLLDVTACAFENTKREFPERIRRRRGEGENAVKRQDK
jgi:hypothetical protein